MVPPWRSTIASTCGRLAFGREKRVEHARLDILWHASPCVGHFDHNVFPLARGAQVDNAAAWQCIDGIEDEIGDCFAQFGGRTVHPTRWLYHDLHRDRAALCLGCVSPARGSEARHVVQDVTGFDPLDLGDHVLSSHERQQTAERLTTFERGAGRDVDHFANAAYFRNAKVELLAHHVAVAGNQR
jgi:hypothetical protein